MAFRSGAVVLGIALSVPVSVSMVAGEELRPGLRIVPATSTEDSPFLNGGDLAQPETQGAPGSRELTVVEETVSLSSRYDSLKVIGEIRNDNENTVGFISIQVVALDSEGRLLEAVRMSVPGVPPCEPVEYPTALLRSGGTIVFRAFLSCDFSEVETVVLRATGSTTSFEPCELALGLIDAWEVEDWGGRIALRGTVRNTTEIDVIDLRVTIVARDPSGAIVDLEREYPLGAIIGGYIGGLHAGDELEVLLSTGIDTEAFDSLSLETRIAGRPYGGGRFEYGVVGIAHSPGANGSSWRSSLGATNLSGAPLSAVLTYYYSGGQVDALLELDADESILYDDVARTLFGVGGQSSGYVQITSSAPLTLRGRTSNESDLGGFGQSLPVYTPEMTQELWFGNLSGLRGGEAFRTNIGLVNMAGNDCACRVRTFTRDGTLLREFAAVELGETDWLQLNDVIPEHVEVAYATVDPGQGCWMWAYASVIEEATGDPTTIEVEPATVIDLAPFSSRGGWQIGSWPRQELPEPTQ